MSVTVHAGHLAAVVRYALETTRATIVCPFHDEVIIRVGDDAAESHAFERAKRIARSDEGRGKEKLSGKSSAGNSAPPLTATARAAVGSIRMPEGKSAEFHPAASERSQASLAMAFAAISCSAFTRVSSFEFSAPSR